MKEVGQVYAFIASVGLEAHVQWSGEIRLEEGKILLWEEGKEVAKLESCFRVTWREAKALAENKHSSSSKPLELESDGFAVELRIYGASESASPRSAANLSSTETSHVFGGIAMGSTYEVMLTCVFGERRLPCGRQIVGTGEYNALFLKDLAK